MIFYTTFLVEMFCRREFSTTKIAKQIIHASILRWTALGLKLLISLSISVARDLRYILKTLHGESFRLIVFFFWC